MYINHDWCTATEILKTNCSPDIEYLALKYRQFYTPREFIARVYIPPLANSKLDVHPEEDVIVAGDFNYADLKSIMP